MANPYSVAEMMLPQSNNMRGLEGMSRTSAPPGPNAYDSGGSSKPSVNTQPYNNERLAAQNMMVRQEDALPQAQSANVQAFRKQNLVQANDEYKDVTFRERRKAEVMEVLGSPATQYMSQMDDIENAAVRNSIATGKAMSVGMNPDLVQNQMGIA
jgi:hypothetical protein